MARNGAGRLANRGGGGRGRAAEGSDGRNRGGRSGRGVGGVSTATRQSLQNREARPIRRGRQGGRGGRLSQRGRGAQQRSRDDHNNGIQQQQQQVGQISRNDNIESNGGNKEQDPPPSPWRYSRAKKKLEALLKDEASWVQIATPYQAYIHDDDFKKYDEKRFIGNFKALKLRIVKVKSAIDFDKHHIAQDRILHPPNPTNGRGEVRYDGSELQKQLKEDVESRKTLGVAPNVLFNSNPLYKNSGMTLKQFRSHKYQEERSLFEGVYWQKKRNNKAKKKHDKDVETMAEL